MTATKPTLKSEIDFAGYPSAGYFDQLHHAEGLVSYWRMDSASTPLADDLGTNNGTIQGSPSLVTGALVNDSDQALSFDGSSNNAYVPNSGSLALNGDFTIEGWVKFTALPGAVKVLVGKQGSWSISIDASNKLRFFLTNDNTSALVTTNAGIASGTWYHLVCVHDSVNDKILIYLNGILDQSTTFTVGPEINAQPLRFGGFVASTSPTRQASTTNSGSSTTPTGNAPASIASGNLLYAQVISNGVGSAMSAEPAGWILRSIKQNATFAVRTYYKIATGSEPATYQWTLGSSENWLVAITRITGQNDLAPFANAQYSASTSGTSHSTGSHTPNQDNNLVMALFANTAVATWTEGGFGTEAYDAAGTGISLAMASATQGTAAAVSVTGTSSVGGNGFAIMEVIAGTGVGYTACQLDDFSFWNVALTAEQVVEHFQARLGGVGSWIDVTGDNVQLTTKMGRLYEQDRIAPASSTTVLENLTRPYDPSNTASTYTGNVLPLRKIRHRADVGGTLYALCRHLIYGWPQEWDGDLETVTLLAGDAFETLNLAGVTGTVASALSGTQINRLLDKAGWATADRAIDAGQFVMVADALTADSKALPEIQTIAESELGIFFIDAAGVATFHDFAHRWTQARSITSQATFSNANDSNPTWILGGLKASFDRQRIVNEWKVSTADGTVKTASDALSISKYFRRTKTLSTRIDDPADAQTVANMLLQQTANPALRYETMAVEPVTDATWQTVLSLAISDRITVIRAPAPAAGGPTITKDFFVEGIAWTIPPLSSSGQWRVTFQLSPCAPSSYYDTLLRMLPVSYWRMNTTT